jgi:multiple sugar transport system ATP-binding protein
VQPGSDVALGFHAERLHFFDPETTERIDVG